MVSQSGTCRLSTPRPPSAVPLPVITSTVLLPSCCARRGMRLALGAAVQIEASVDLDAAARQPLLQPTIDRDQRRSLARRRGKPRAQQGSVSPRQGHGFALALHEAGTAPLGVLALERHD